MKKLISKLPEWDALQWRHQMTLQKASHGFFDPGSVHARWKLWMKESLVGHRLALASER